MAGAKRKKVIYLAGPYRSPEGLWGIHQNIEHARAYARQLWFDGFVVLCPHLNTAYMDAERVNADLWLQGDLLLMRRCDAVVVMPGYEKSSGTLGEIEDAKRNWLPVFYLPSDIEHLKTWRDEA